MKSQTITATVLGAAAAMLAAPWAAAVPHGPPAPPPNAFSPQPKPPRGPGTFTPSGPSTPGPSSPSSPGPASPTSPAPTTPNAGGSSGPLTGGSALPRGVVMTFTRGDTSRERLRVRWDYPVPRETDQVLTYEEVLVRLRGDDPRPLLVLRECGNCVGTNKALLGHQVRANERMLLLTRWFHCIKLPPHAAEPGHPFHNLFAGDEDMMLVTADEGKRLTFSGRQAQTKLWKAMNDILRREYERSANASIGKLMRLLDEFDTLDAKERDLQEQLDRALVAAGPSAPRTVKLVRQLSDLQRQKQRVVERERQLADLGLRKPEIGKTGD